MARDRRLEFAIESDGILLSPQVADSLRSAQRDVLPACNGFPLAVSGIEQASWNLTLLFVVCSCIEH